MKYLLLVLLAGCHSYKPHNARALESWNRNSSFQSSKDWMMEDEFYDLSDSLHKYCLLALSHCLRPDSGFYQRKYDSFYASYDECYKIMQLK
jgi:hypothetical protein